MDTFKLLTVNISQHWLIIQAYAFAIGSILLISIQASHLRSPSLKSSLIRICCISLIMVPFLYLLRHYVNWSIPWVVQHDIEISNIHQYTHPETLIPHQQAWLHPTLTICILGISMLISSLRALKLSFNYRSLSQYVSQLKQQSIRVPFYIYQDMNDIAEKIGLSQQPEIFLDKANHGAFTYGFFKPRIVLPIAILTMEKEQQQVFLTHELLHIKRHDWLLQQLCLCIGIMLPMLPIVGLLRRILERDAELAVDAASLEITDRATYTQTLIEQLRYQHDQHFFGSTSLGAGQDISIRIDRLLKEPYAWQPTNVTQWLPLTTAILGVLIVILSIQIRHQYQLHWVYTQPMALPPATVSNNHQVEPQSTIQALAQFPNSANVAVNPSGDKDSHLIPKLTPNQTSQAKLDRNIPLPREPQLIIDYRDEKAAWNTKYLVKENMVTELPQLMGQTNTDNETNRLLIQPTAEQEVIPTYPNIALRRQLEADVEVSFNINNQGQVVDPVITADTGNGVFDKAVLKAIRATRYNLNKAANIEFVQQNMTQTYQFRLKPLRQTQNHQYQQSSQHIEHPPP